jgi:hypothetical protein
MPPESLRPPAASQPAPNPGASASSSSLVAPSFISEDRDVVPTPPYSRQAFGPLGLPPDDSPAYRSTATLARMPPATQADTDVDRKPSAVHYPSDVKQAPDDHHTGHALPHVDSRASSRPPSVAGTDDEGSDEDDYDWSGEEDLVDEAAKFEQKIGNAKAKRKRWGFRKSVPSALRSSTCTDVFSGSSLSSSAPSSDP